MELVAIINKHYENLNNNDLYVLNYILEHKVECQNMSITQLSKKCNMSTSSILRMTQKLGFSGYSEFKFALKNDLSNKIDFKQFKSKKNYIELFENSINDTLKHFQNTNTKEIIKCLKDARHVYIYGTGWAQKLAGEQLMRVFFSCNRPIILIQHYTEFKLMLPNYTKDDFIIIISLSGKIEHIIDSLRILKLNNVPTLSITDFKNNQLASLATYNLYYQSVEIMKKTTDNSTPEANSMGSLQVLCELLYIKYIETYLNISKE
ncbi:MurR/RpiR family transcriptional regulator [Caldibacillus thermoamylovorans]|jgi:RpiR family glv operon transcriptional regulator|uniref:MurR/RpiR family transcriptional regulator n=1 Tax=Bacillaceae TaxID=186817 RepID=UPI001C1082F7|nr:MULTISPECIES: MurR/RpiR family transcriptional regulator [Bacillaceae]MBU5342221.1 MurR/RpiR family transcriptional regulator [Caldifermentibacillus hisashii]MCB5936480.1 MurR/RpiR family transcriptional regulator [Bacillus sp. DFI.2.34]MCB7077917.1 MurR/RpiR family transcriptional regulator [Caldibacillus thermoamylovorans]MEC5271906.1 MurR/RpiR family transcriptional regulator [Caldifermentibacillus hisashii]